MASHTTQSADRYVACPSCGGKSLFSPTNRFRPFCSERCKNVDLGAWASEGYRVPARPSSSDHADAGDVTPSD